MPRCIHSYYHSSSYITTRHRHHHLFAGRVFFRLRWQTNMNACVLLMKMQNLNWVQVNRNQQEERRRFAIANMKKWLQITIISSQSILNNEYKYMHTCHLVISFTKQCYHLHHKIISIPAPGLTPNAINPFLLFCSSTISCAIFCIRQLSPCTVVTGHSLSCNADSLSLWTLLSPLLSQFDFPFSKSWILISLRDTQSCHYHLESQSQILHDAFFRSPTFFV